MKNLFLYESNRIGVVLVTYLYYYRRQMEIGGQMKLLSRSEEIVLLAIWKLQGNAYGVTIRSRVSETTGREWAIGSIYPPLHRLERKDMVIAIKGEPIPERGGRSGFRCRDPQAFK